MHYAMYCICTEKLSTLESTHPPRLSLRGIVSNPHDAQTRRHPTILRSKRQAAILLLKTQRKDKLHEFDFRSK